MKKIIFISAPRTRMAEIELYIETICTSYRIVESNINEVQWMCVIFASEYNQIKEYVSSKSGVDILSEQD